ncbi:winged helix-turn-helix domain-containing protein [Halococcus saccharolyticus]|uniref:ArsR family transcription regulator n=1 Tax=Halococcus saccharolyticus DSM 5350 TaxID=1227455 RepID=M0MPE2_9EURY|nr:winged helix-turn-helix domain-containing protein [Halococcus saccharolyticus]EMA47243.1 ArsR family transcription regulator [Halococcus saccharolyticus DSM 5350]
MSLTLTDAKRTILALLADKPRHGYALASEVGVQGSTMYEHLQQLEGAGYVTSHEDGRRRMYKLTRRGELTVEADQIGDSTG